MRNKNILVIILISVIGIIFLSMILKNQDKNTILKPLNNNPAEGTSSGIVSINGSGTNNAVVRTNLRDFEQMYKEFESIENQESFDNFYKHYGSDPILISALRQGKKQDFDKYFNYYWIKLGNTTTTPKGDFNTLLSALFSEIRQGIVTVNTKDIGIDLKVYFNQIPLQDALNNCEELKKYGQIYSDVNDCHGTIYFFRATKQNHYCDKIQIEPNKRLCLGFLDYLDTQK